MYVGSYLQSTTALIVQAMSKNRSVRNVAKEAESVDRAKA